MLLPLLMSTLAAAAPCAQTSTPDDLRAAIAKSEAAYGAFDPDAFVAGIDEALLLLPCLTAPPEPAALASLHRALALRAVGAGQDPRPWLRAAVLAAPESTWSEGTLPSAHQIHSIEAEVRAVPPMLSPSPRPRAGWELWLDGRETRKRDPALPVVAQTFNGLDWSTQLVPPGAPLPAYPAIPKERPTLWAAAGGLAAASLACVAGGLATEAAFHDPDTVAGLAPESAGARLSRLQRQSVALAVGSGLFGLGAATSAGVALTVYR